MKKLVALILLALALPATGQVIYACQYSRAIGFVSEQGSWKSTTFKLEKPFFLSLDSRGLPDEKSLAVFRMMPNKVTCERFAIDRDAIGCGEGQGASGLTFNTKTLEGAVSAIFGAGLTDPPRDTLSIKVFSCQKM